MNSVDLWLNVVMNHYNYVMYVYWLHCMSDWLENRVFGLKYEFCRSDADELRLSEALFS